MGRTVIVDEKGELTLRLELLSYESPDIPEAFLVVQTWRPMLHITSSKYPLIRNIWLICLATQKGVLAGKTIGPLISARLSFPHRSSTKVSANGNAVPVYIPRSVSPPVLQMATDLVHDCAEQLLRTCEDWEEGLPRNEMVGNDNRFFRVVEFCGRC